MARRDACDATAPDLAGYLCDAFDLQIAVVTDGERGATIATRHGECWTAATQRAAVNSTGAGDAVAAGIAVGLGARVELDATLNLAVQAAGDAVTTPCTCPEQPCVSDV
jgi:sugar/nucleoside kinase (ribokinase family)